MIQRRPHFSAHHAVVPEPQVGSNTRSPGSEVIRRQRSTTLVLVWTTYTFSSVKLPVRVSVQRLPRSLYGKSEAKRRYSIGCWPRRGYGSASARRSNPVGIVRFPVRVSSRAVDPCPRTRKRLRLPSRALSLQCYPNLYRRAPSGNGTFPDAFSAAVTPR